MEREITEKERRLMGNAIAEAQETIGILSVKVEHTDFMLEKGLAMNLADNKRRIKKEKAQMVAALEFEEKLVKQYNDILEIGKIDEPEPETKPEEEIKDE